MATNDTGSGGLERQSTFSGVNYSGNSQREIVQAPRRGRQSGLDNVIDGEIVVSHTTSVRPVPGARVDRINRGIALRTSGSTARQNSRVRSGLEAVADLATTATDPKVRMVGGVASIVIKGSYALDDAGVDVRGLASMVGKHARNFGQSQAKLFACASRVFSGRGAEIAPVSAQEDAFAYTERLSTAELADRRELNAALEQGDRRVRDVVLSTSLQEHVAQGDRGHVVVDEGDLEQLALTAGAAGAAVRAVDAAVDTTADDVAQVQRAEDEHVQVVLSQLDTVDDQLDLTHRAGQYSMGNVNSEQPVTDPFVVDSTGMVVDPNNSVQDPDMKKMVNDQLDAAGMTIGDPNTADRHTGSARDVNGLPPVAPEMQQSNERDYAKNKQAADFMNQHLNAGYVKNVDPKVIRQAIEPVQREAAFDYRHGVGADNPFDKKNIGKSVKDAVHKERAGHDHFVGIMVSTALMPLRKGIDAENVISAAGSLAVMWMLSPKFREITDDIAHQFSESLKKRQEQRWKFPLKGWVMKTVDQRKRARAMSQDIKNGMDAEQARIVNSDPKHAPYTVDSAAMGLLRVNDQAFDAMRAKDVSSADIAAIKDKHAQVVEGLEREWTRDGLDKNDVYDKAQWIIGNEAQYNSQMLAKYAHSGDLTCHNVTARTSAGPVSSWDGKWRSRQDPSMTLNNSMDFNKIFAPREPMSLAEHKAEMQSQLHSELSTRLNNIAADDTPQSSRELYQFAVGALAVNNASSDINDVHCSVTDGVRLKDQLVASCAVDHMHTGGVDQANLVYADVAQNLFTDMEKINPQAYHKFMSEVDVSQFTSDIQAMSADGNAYVESLSDVSVTPRIARDYYTQPMGGVDASAYDNRVQHGYEDSHDELGPDGKFVVGTALSDNERAQVAGHGQQGVEQERLAHSDSASMGRHDISAMDVKAQAEADAAQVTEEPASLTPEEIKDKERQARDKRRTQERLRRNALQHQGVSVDNGALGTDNQADQSLDNNLLDGKVARVQNDIIIEELDRKGIVNRRSREADEMMSSRIPVSERQVVKDYRQAQKNNDGPDMDM